MAEAQKGIQATLFDYLQDTECLFVDNRTDTRYNRISGGVCYVIASIT